MKGPKGHASFVPVLQMVGAEMSIKYFHDRAFRCGHLSIVYKFAFPEGGKPGLKFRILNHIPCFLAFGKIRYGFHVQIEEVYEKPA